jgi:hypothetical protein
MCAPHISSGHLEHRQPSPLHTHDVSITETVSMVTHSQIKHFCTMANPDHKASKNVSTKIDLNVSKIQFFCQGYKRKK